MIRELILDFKRHWSKMPVERAQSLAAEYLCRLWWHDFDATLGTPITKPMCWNDSIHLHVNLHNEIEWCRVLDVVEGWLTATGKIINGKDGSVTSLHTKEDVFLSLTFKPGAAHPDEQRNKPYSSRADALQDHRELASVAWDWGMYPLFVVASCSYLACLLHLRKDWL